MSPRLPLVLLTLLSGCGLLQSYGAGLEVICDAPADCVPCMGAPPDMRAVMLAAHIDENLRNRKARALFEQMAAMSGQQRAATLREEAAASGLGECAFAALYDAPTKPPMPPAPAPEAGLEAEGALDKGEIQRVLDENRSRFRQCYETELLKKPDLAGKVVLRFTIGADGAIDEVSVSDNGTGNAPLSACLVEAAKRMEFPPPEGGGDVEVTYPFIFSPG